VTLKKEVPIKNSMDLPFLKLSEEVAQALANQHPVVALESTIISHGMPYPKNIETAMAVEDMIRRNGAIPATIAIIEGVMCVGLSQAQLELIGKPNTFVTKTSRRDLPIIIAAGKHGATTVAATMIIAAKAGIKIFATGGIGGVHRGGHHTMDVSADLQELAQTNVTVVCAGAKSILDLERTLEYLETFGVPVIGYQTSEFPAFYSRKSGLNLMQTADDPLMLAKIIQTKEILALKGGCVIANPIPLDYEMEYANINEAINQAIEEADKKEIKGKEITPFLLNKIKELTAGKSLEANIKLVLNNAQLAAKIAVQMHQLTT